MTNDEILEKAAARGLLRLVAVEAGAADLVLWVAIDTDFDSRFEAVCADTGDVLNVNGWACLLHDDAEGRADVAARYGDWREQPAAIAATARTQPEA